MHILYLGSNNLNMINFLQADGNFITRREDVITEHDLIGVDYIISYGYRHIIGKNVMEKIRFKAVNLHISFLPWNRGADPNLWSFLEDTPKGVTIHYMNEGLDTGEIIAQQEIGYSEEDTLKSTYDRLRLCVENLFYQEWKNIKANAVTYQTQEKGMGSYHKSCAKEIYLPLLADGWDTKIGEILGKGIMSPLR